MSYFWTGNLLLLISIICGSVSQILFKVYLNRNSPVTLDSSILKHLTLSSEILLPLAALVLLAMGFGFWILSLSRLDLSYAYPIASSSVLLVMALSLVFLQETVTPKMWLGAGLIVIGTILLANSQTG